MRVRVQRTLPHSSQQCNKSRIARHIRPQRQRVHKKPYQRLYFRMAAPRHYRRYHQILLPRVLQQQRLEARQQRHKQRRALPPAQRPQPAQRLGL